MQKLKDGKETGVTYLHHKGFWQLLVNTRNQKRTNKDPSEGSREHGPSDTMILDAQPLEP